MPPSEPFTPTGPVRGRGAGARVWLIRHGEVHEDFHGLAYGGMDVPLSARGLAETREFAARFAAEPIERVYASTLQRARALGERIAEATRAPIELDAGLVEIDRGRWQGLPQKELMERFGADVAAFYADPWNWRKHGGETDADVRARAWPVLERALDSGAATVAIVCHYNVVRNLIAQALGIAPNASFRIRIDLTSAALLRDTPQGWRLERCNVRSPAGSARSSSTA